MSKKRKTRKQKEMSQQRQVEHLQHSHNEAPIYSVKVSRTEASKNITVKREVETTVAQKDAAYLRHDMVAISASTGIVLAFDILLFVLLNGGALKLNFLGY